ncbi:MAG: YeiH family protein [Desulfovibrio sp.]|nr:YeiH family protein [Desulfovibrio sp.]
MAEQIKPAEDIVIDKGSASWSDLWTKEDYWAIWLGFALLVVGLFVFLPAKPKDMDTIIATSNTVMEAEAARAPFKTMAWYKAQDDKQKLKATSSDAGKFFGKWLATPGSWSTNPLDSLMRTQEQADALNEKAKPKYEEAKAKTAAALMAAQEAEAAAEAASFQDEGLNTAAEEAIGAWRKAKASESKAKSATERKPFNRIPTLAVLGLVMALFFAIGAKFMGKDVAGFVKGFSVVYVLSVVSYVLAGQETMKQYGVEYAVWAIAFGMLIANTVGTPKWVKPALEVEYFIKTGLVLLGAEVLLSKIIAIGIPGIFVAWVVTPIVLITTFIFGQKVLKMPSRTLNMVISADMSVCGTSAAIATAAACRAKKEELTLAIGLSLVFTAIMMVAMPAFIKAVGMPHILGGAWMGGTIDATGAVAAAGAFLSEKALYVAATIKMIQNVLIGFTAFGVAVYWCAKVDCVEGQRVSWMEIWYRFPKFVLGFLSASIIFSLLDGALGSDAGYTLIDHGVLRGFTGMARGWFFCLAFAAIGLATNFRELAHHFKGGKPLILYVCGQTFNLILTLIMAYLMFYVVFPEITAKI